MNNSNDFIGTASEICFSNIIINTNTDYLQITEMLMVLQETLCLKVHLEFEVWQQLVVALSNAKVLQPLVVHIVLLHHLFVLQYFQISN